MHTPVTWFAFVLVIAATVAAGDTRPNPCPPGSTQQYAPSKRSRLGPGDAPVQPCVGTARRGTSSTPPSAPQQQSQTGRALQQLGPDVYVGKRWPWQFNGLTLYFATPVQAGSTSISGDAKFTVFKDGTAKLGAGAAVSTSYARSREGPGTNPRDDRPFVATQAYVTVPRLLGWTAFPSISYNLAEGDGSVASLSQGYMVVGELAYNGLSNTFGVSLAQGQSGSLNLPIARPGSGLVMGDGFSGIEQIAGANSLTLLTDPRTNQFAQGVAYPFNILTPFNPLTCTQTMITSAVSTWGDLSGPVRPTPRDQPLFLVPFCTEFFNTQVLDNFHLFLQDYLDYYYGYQDAYYNDYEDMQEVPGGADGAAASEPGGATEPQRTRASSTPCGSPAPAADGEVNSTSCMGPAAILTGVSRVQAPSSVLPLVPVLPPPRPEPRTSAPPAADQSLQVSNRPVDIPGQAGNSTTGLYRTASVRVAGFGGQPLPLAESGAVAASLTDLASAAAAAEKWQQHAPVVSTQPSGGLGARNQSSQQSGLPERTVEGGAATLNATTAAALITSRPVMSVARSPAQLFPSGLRSSPTPRPEDINALVKLGQVVTQQLEALPIGKLLKGSAQSGAGAAASVLANTASDASGLAKDVWNLTNQVALLGAKTLLNTFMSSAQAVLPLTQLIYNNSNGWYQAAASASNRLADQRIAGLAASQEQLATQTASAASLLQDLSATMASSFVSAFNAQLWPPATAPASAQERAGVQPTQVLTDATIPQQWNPTVGGMSFGPM